MGAPANFPVSDAELVIAARRHESWAERALFERYTERVTRLAHRLLKGGPDVDDLVQEVFVSAFASLKRLERPAVFGTWLYEITVRMSSKLLRRLRLRDYVDIDVAESIASEALASTAASPDITADLRVVYDVLDTMPQDAAIALVLRRFEGRTIAEVGEAMGLSAATVKRRLAVAEERLIARLGRGE